MAARPGGGRRRRPAHSRASEAYARSAGLPMRAVAAVTVAQPSKGAEAELQGRLRRYRYQLTHGCGRPSCVNPLCATANARLRGWSPVLVKLTALQLASSARDGPDLCAADPAEASQAVGTIQPQASESRPTTLSETFLSRLFDTRTFARVFFGGPPEDAQDPDTASPTPGQPRQALTHLTFPLITAALKSYTQTRDPTFLLNTLRANFGDIDALARSFRSPQSPEAVSLEEVQAVYQALIKSRHTVPGLQDALQQAVLQATAALKARAATLPASDLAAVVLILLRNPFLALDERVVAATRRLCETVLALPDAPRRSLCSQMLQSKIEIAALQHCVSRPVRANRRIAPQSIPAVCVLDLLFRMNEERLASEGQRPLLVSAFYNNRVSTKIDFKEEYQLWKSGDSQPTYLHWPFLLDPAAKARVLHIDAVMQMSEVFQGAFVHQAWVYQSQKILEEQRSTASLSGPLRNATNPYLVLEIRRDHIVEDTLWQISQKSKELKKPLKIKFVGGGEQGLDLGGLQKEFFQLITDEILDVQNTMFTYSTQTRTFWINGQSFEADAEFELVGIVLGLAIYNGVILDVKFPMVLYKKLLGGRPNLHDLKLAQPALASSLEQLLAYDGDVEEVFGLSYEISDQQMDGKARDISLLPDGANIPVTNANRRHFVDNYVAYLLTDSVSQQASAFSRGFHLVCGGDVLTMFCPEELELLICGSPAFDFSELEAAAAYDGYSDEAPIVGWLWDVVREMSEDQQKRLLHFVTGSDRVPIRGLGTLQLVVQRNGPNSNRLPTALTCFSRLLLPEYDSREKLRKRLLLAIEYGQGFGLV